MLVTFSTDAYENLSYFQDIAQRLLSLMGHSASIPGAIKAYEVQQALDKLNAAVTNIPHTENPNVDNIEANISLKQRAIPLIKLLEAAAKKKCDVLWR